QLPGQPAIQRGGRQRLLEEPHRECRRRRRLDLVEVVSEDPGVRTSRTQVMDGTIHLFDRLPQVARRSSAAPGAWAPPTRAVPLIGVVRNTRSHRNHSAIPEAADGATLLVETPARREELAGILARFADRRVDYIVVDGG